jgi:predicted SAM-dependent methyltransferase
MEKLPYLNLGCGLTFNKQWTNVDFVSTGEGVIAHNLTKGIPFDNNSFEVVYHSHVLEHFSQKDAEKFISECYRVLKPNGIIRVAIPDLEAITRNYIKYLDALCMNNNKADKEKYDWTMIELFDQVVRNNTGGAMVEYIKDTTKNNDDFIVERNGYEIVRLFEIFREKQNHSVHKTQSGLSGLKSKIKASLLRFILKNDYNALQIGKFRLSGEIHQWMYDRYSLSELLVKQGFSNTKVVSVDESQILNWKSFELEIRNGKIRKPDSLFMEAQKK